jgi:hypothetical protein
MLDQKDLNITELTHLIYAAATVITEEINGTTNTEIKTTPVGQAHPGEHN